LNNKGFNLDKLHPTIDFGVATNIVNFWPHNLTLWCRYFFCPGERVSVFILQLQTCFMLHVGVGEYRRTPWTLIKKCYETKNLLQKETSMIQWLTD